MKHKYLEPLAASHLTYYTNGNTSAGTFPKHFFLDLDVLLILH